MEPLTAHRHDHARPLTVMIMPARPPACVQHGWCSVSFARIYDLKKSTIAFRLNVRPSPSPTPAPALPHRSPIFFPGAFSCGEEATTQMTRSSLKLVLPATQR